jgi:hypothetical protein
MNRPLAAALALLAAVPLAAQPIADQSTALPLPGTWTYTASADGGEAVFTDASNQPLLSLRCVRSIRRVVLSKPASAASPTLGVWSSTASKSWPATYDAATARLSAQIANWDPVLDAISYSRGRFAVAAAGQQPLVVPDWADISRIAEDCRA